MEPRWNQDGTRGKVTAGNLTPGNLTPGYFKNIKGASARQNARCVWGDNMDFEIVVRQIRKAYQEGDYSPWSLEDFVMVFARFYSLYRAMNGCEHPVLKTMTIARVMALLIRDVNGMMYSPDDYLETDLFECYFVTRFKPSCDYSIVHFTSGDVRYYKTFESC